MMRKDSALQILQFAKSTIVSDISLLYEKHIGEVALIVEETKSDEAKFSFIVDLTMNVPSISFVRMRYIKQHVHGKRSVIKNPDQLDLLAKTND